MFDTKTSHVSKLSDDSFCEYYKKGIQGEKDKLKEAKRLAISAKKEKQTVLIIEEKADEKGKDKEGKKQDESWELVEPSDVVNSDENNEEDSEVLQ